jgi:hypothetical protein
MKHVDRGSYSLPHAIRGCLSLLRDGVGAHDSPASATRCHLKHNNLDRGQDEVVRAAVAGSGRASCPLEASAPLSIVRDSPSSAIRQRSTSPLCASCDILHQPRLRNLPRQARTW